MTNIGLIKVKEESVLKNCSLCGLIIAGNKSEKWSNNIDYEYSIYLCANCRENQVRIYNNGE